MAANVNTGMQKADMKKLLIRSKSEPVNCAIGIGENNALGLLMLHRTKTGKACEAMLKQEFPDAKNLRWGTAFVDTEDNPKLVKITLNRAVAGMAKRLTKTLKGTGFTKVVLVGEDGSAIETHEESDETDAVAEAAAPAAAATADAVPPPPPAPPPAPDTQDKAAQTERLKQVLGILASQIVAAAGDDPARKAVLAKLATDAKTNIDTGNLVYAANALDQLKRALQPADTATAANPAAVVASSRIAWVGARTQVSAEVGKLRDALAVSYAGQPFAAEIETKFQATVAPVLASFDDKLLVVLDRMEGADAQGRTALMGEARGLLKTYLSYAMSEKLIDDLDNNPFVPLSIRSTVTSTLSKLAKALV